MSKRVQILVVVVLLALAAAGTAVAVTVATRQNPEQPQAAKGKPPIGDDLPTPAADEIRQTFKDWPKNGLETMERLGREYPKDPVVQLYRGIALVWAGYPIDAEQALVKAKKVGRDTPWEVQADTLLHPDFIERYPTFRPLTANPLLEAGSRLQAEGKQHSALAKYQQAARKAPNDCEAQVAVAVGSFDKTALNRSFSKLGPLTRKFPKCQAVRYYLGILLAWTKQREAVEQFQKTVALGPDTELGKLAARYLGGGSSAGTGP